MASSIGASPQNKHVLVILFFESLTGPQNAFTNVSLWRGEIKFGARGRNTWRNGGMYGGRMMLCQRGATPWSTSLSPTTPRKLWSPNHAFFRSPQSIMSDHEPPLRESCSPTPLDRGHNTMFRDTADLQIGETEPHPNSQHHIIVSITRGPFLPL